MSTQFQVACTPTQVQQHVFIVCIKKDEKRATYNAFSFF